MTDQFINQIFRTSVAALSQKLGWDAAQTSAIDILADIWKRQLVQIGKTCHRYAEHHGRSEVSTADVVLAFKDMNLSIPELEEYVQNFDPVPLPFRTPKYPVSKVSNLNFLRPGSKEVLSRPVHIHEYMPPCEIPEENAERNGIEKTEPSRRHSVSYTPPTSVASSSLEVSKPVNELVKAGEPEPISKIDPSESDNTKEDETVEHQPQAAIEPFFRSFASSTKRGSSAAENPALKRVRILMQEEGHPLREISSVMMTTSGFLSSSREGRLPESRPPANRDFFDPEPAVEKKRKSVTMKKIVEGVKKIEKENQDEVEIFGKPDRLIVISEGKHKSDSSKKSKDRESSKTKEKEDTTRNHEKETKSDKLKIFKKKSRDPERHSKHHEREKDKERIEVKMDLIVEQDLEEISSEEGSFMNEVQVKPTIISNVDHHDRRKKKVEENRKEKKRERNRDRPVPGVIPIPRISPKMLSEMPRMQPIKDMESLKSKHNKPVGFPPFSFTTKVNPSNKPLKVKKRHLDIKSLIPEISINITKPLPPLPELKPFFSSMSMAPGLVPTSLGPPPPLKFGGSSLSPSITITPAAGALSNSTKESRKSTTSSISIPPTVCSSVTITRIDMPNSIEPKFEPVPAVSVQHSSGRQSPIAVHADSTSGITITPILMTGDHNLKAERFEKPGGSGTITLLDEGQSSKEQRRKEKEKRKEIKKEKKKEKREKLREKERLQRDKEEKVQQPVIEKPHRKESREIEPTVPKLTLKIGHSSASTPVDNPNPNRVTERTEPPSSRKITIKPIEDLVVSKRTPSPEMARFSPLVTRAPKIPKVAVPKPSPPVVPPAVHHVEKPSSERKSSKSSKSSKSKASSSSQSGLVTETVGFYIDEHGNKIWICPAVGCGREDDGSPMIGCDNCDDWYHFICVGIETTPDDNDNWYCPRCVKKGTRPGRS